MDSFQLEVAQLSAPLSGRRARAASTRIRRMIWLETAKKCARSCHSNLCAPEETQPGLVDQGRGPERVPGFSCPCGAWQYGAVRRR